MTETPSEPKPEHVVFDPAEHSAEWKGPGGPIAYTARSEWIVIHRKEKPVAIHEIYRLASVGLGGEPCDTG